MPSARNKGVMFTRKDIGPDARKEEKKEEGAKIGIAGSIHLPKEWAAAGKEE